MIKTPLSTVLGGAFWTPGCTVVGGNTPTFDQQILKIFANGEQGFAYDPSDLTTLYQDAAGTVPVTEAGQPVGLIRDKSGRNNHAYQTTSASRPILRQNAVTGANYLEFDGSDDFLQTNNIDFTGTDKVTVIAGVRKLSDATRGLVFEHGVNSVRGFRLFSPDGSGYPSYTAYSSAGTVATATTGSTYPAPISNVISIITDISSSKLQVKVNGILAANVNSSQGSGNYDNLPIYIGRRGGSSFPFNGHIYGLIGVGKLAPDRETVDIEKELAKRVGVTLNV